MSRSIERRLWPIWRKWNGVLPLWAVTRAGIRADSFRRWARNNADVDHVGRGAYIWYPDDAPAEDDWVGADWRLQRFSVAMAEAGPDAVLWGPSVVEATRLGTIGGGNTCLMVPRPRRPKDGVTWIVRNEDDLRAGTVEVHGMPAQPILRALAATVRRTDSDKIIEAIWDARHRRLITREQYEDLMEAVANWWGRGSAEGIPPYDPAE